MRRGTRVKAGRVRFRYDGRDIEGQPGDTAASALLACGVRYFGRSVKYRRLRGVLAAGPEEPNGLFTVGTPPAVVPNVPAPMLVLREGHVLSSQNRWPTLALDFASLLQAGGGFFGAGFYYKTFMWPKWRTYEPLIRRLAGLGAAPGACELPPASVENLSCDVLIAGGGAAGLAAARAAARAGARVVLCEREPVCGGELEFEGGSIEGQPALAWVTTTVAELAERGARILHDTALVGGSGGQLVLHATAEQRSGRQHAVPRPAAFIRRCNGRRRASDRLHRQRSTGRNASWGGRTLPRALWCAGRARSGSLRQSRPGVCGGSALGGGGAAHSRDRRHARRGGPRFERRVFIARRTAEVRDRVSRGSRGHRDGGRATRARRANRTARRRRHGGHPCRATHRL